MSYLPDRSSIRKHAAASLGIPVVLFIVGPEAGTCRRDMAMPDETQVIGTELEAMARVAHLVTRTSRI